MNSRVGGSVLETYLHLLTLRGCELPHTITDAVYSSKRGSVSSHTSYYVTRDSYNGGCDSTLFTTASGGCTCVIPLAYYLICISICNILTTPLISTYKKIAIITYLNLQQHSRLINLEAQGCNSLSTGHIWFFYFLSRFTFSSLVF